MGKMETVLAHVLSHPPRGCRVAKVTEDGPNTDTMHTVVVEVREIIDDVKHAVPPPCMVLRLEHITPQRVIAHLDTLKYGSQQSACSIPGHQLLKWVIQLAEKRLVYSIELLDASRTDIAGTLVSLQLFRKFCTGQSWYEQYGFLPMDEHERWAFQRSFDVVRRCPTKVVGSFLWLIVQPFLSIKANKNVRPANVEFSSVLDKQAIQKCVNACRGPLTCLSYHPVTRDTLTETIMHLTKSELWPLWKFLRRIGLSHNDICISRMTTRLHDYLINENGNGQCFSQLAPDRRVMNLIMNHL